MDFQQQNQQEAPIEQPSAYNTQPTETPVSNQAVNQEPTTMQQTPAQGPVASQQAVTQEPTAPQQTVNQEPPAPQQASVQATGTYNQQPAQGQPPYGYDRQTPYQNRQPYGNNNGYQNPYQNPYQNAYQGSNSQQGNTPYGSPNQNDNGYPYYNRGAYQLPPKEPGSGFAGAAMILGILSIVFCLTFTVYPAFILGSIAIVLALLSKGSRSTLLDKARTGIICGTIGLITNTILVTSVVVMLFTNPELRDEVNKTFERQYGVTFDEMMDEILEESGFSE